MCEVFGATGYIRTAYTYSPYGSVTATGNVTQPIQWSSEYHDEELGLVYYNYRYYNVCIGRWMRRDPLGITAGTNTYNILNNHHTGNIDWVGLSEYKPYLPTGLTLPPSAFTEEKLKENNLAFFIIGNKKEKKGKGLYNAIISAFKKVTALTTTIMDKESLIDECTQQKGCIKSLKITAHGHGSLAHAVLYTSKEEIWENIDKEEISDMLGSFVFCKKNVILN